MAQTSMTVCFIVFFVAPFAAMYAFPRFLARLALVPIGGERRIPLSETAASAPGRQITANGGYRDSPLVHIDIGNLPGPRVVERAGDTLLFYPEHAEILARRTLSFFSRRARPFVRVRVQTASNQIVLRAKWLTLEPLFFIAVFPFMIYGTNMRSSADMVPALIAMAFIVSSLGIAFAYFPAKALVDAAETEVRSRIAQLSAAAR